MPSFRLPEVLNLSPHAMLYALTEHLAAEFPDHHLLATASWSFQIEGFASEGHCQFDPLEIPVEYEYRWEMEHRLSRANIWTGWFSVQWEEQSYFLLCVNFHKDYGRQRHWFLLGETEAATRRFFEAVSQFATEVTGEVLVFDGGCWAKDKDLFDSIQNSTWDDLILEGDLKAEIRQDLEGFFKAGETYRKYKIPWKRGILFLGPPGNGKTHTIKAIVGSIGFPCLYVKSLKAEHQTDHQLIGEVFDRTRATAPCVLVLEDLDALIDDENRSFFLNELDGFAANEGSLTIGTTNHPERLDPAILERPSRFDRKYTFRLPGELERSAYLHRFSEKLEPDLRLDDEDLKIVAEATDEYSFAYLKELYLSSLMSWISAPGERPIREIMLGQCQTLRSQMTTEPEPESQPSPQRRSTLTPAMMRAYMDRWR